MEMSEISKDKHTKLKEKNIYEIEGKQVQGRSVISGD